MNLLRLSNEDYSFIYNKVPRLAIDLVIYKDSGIILVQRAIEPYLHQWHLPGGTVYKGEDIKSAALRIAKNETGLNVEYIKCLDYLEFPNEHRGEVQMHTVSLVIEAKAIDGTLMHDNDTK